ncbi:MAG: hypothetical protein FWD69_10010 [Polyangiaceae bacterium]|nr:hypothetical protein [Polyangiaceae bacterium]
MSGDGGVLGVGGAKCEHGVAEQEFGSGLEIEGTMGGAFTTAGDASLHISRWMLPVFVRITTAC